MQNDQFKEVVVLVTGASRGIGKAISDSFGARGATIIGTATSDKGSAAISERFTAAGFTGTGMTLDVTDPAATEAVFAAISEQFSPVSVLINNAGTVCTEPVAWRSNRWSRRERAVSSISPQSSG